MKVADVRLVWTPSPTPGVVGRKVIVTNAGDVKSFDMGPEDGSLEIVVAANATVSFQTIVTTADGLSATSATFTRTYGDLTAPMPDTGLEARVIQVRDVADPVPPAAG